MQKRTIVLQVNILVKMTHKRTEFNAARTVSVVADVALLLTASLYLCLLDTPFVVSPSYNQLTVAVEHHPTSTTVK